ncbi:DUF3307 domain-containing protein [Kitasatospora sp. NBC_01300]|uniref:DUF3307 domain-containing protein n=1 Tax=Kitasatospora sp. NBC_01300 TaxID=2903574 RepID=UPI002F910EAA|nr:DUF3307 domain-containing protein [Kitasatospora sp. NBC_01300]
MFASLFVVLFVGHFAGDYLLQTDHISEHKAARSWTGARAALAHVGCHVTATVAALLAASAATGLHVSAVAAAAGIGWVGLSHGLIDRRWPISWWMRHTGSAAFEAAGGAPLADQAAHVVVGLFPAALLIAALS